MPQAIGIVLLPYRASPSMSSMSLIASLISVSINANPAYKNPSLMILFSATSQLPSAGPPWYSPNSDKHKISMTQEVSTEIKIFPESNFCFSEIEYPNNKKAHAKLASTIYQSPVFQDIYKLSKTPIPLNTKCQRIAHLLETIRSTTFFFGLFTWSIFTSK